MSVRYPMTVCSSAQIIQVAEAVPVLKDTKLIQLITLPVYVSITSSVALLYIEYAYLREPFLMAIASLMTKRRPLHKSSSQMWKSKVQMFEMSLNTRTFTHW